MWEIAGDGSGMPKFDLGSIFLGSRSESFMNPVTWNGRAFSGRLKHTVLYHFPPMYWKYHGYSCCWSHCFFLSVHVLVRGDRFMDIESIQCIPEG